MASFLHIQDCCKEKRGEEAADLSEEATSHVGAGDAGTGGERHSLGEIAAKGHLRKGLWLSNKYRTNHVNPFSACPSPAYHFCLYDEDVSLSALWDFLSWPHHSHRSWLLCARSFQFPSSQCWEQAKAVTFYYKASI